MFPLSICIDSSLINLHMNMEALLAILSCLRMNPLIFCMVLISLFLYFFFFHLYLREEPMLMNIALHNNEFCRVDGNKAL